MTAQDEGDLPRCPLSGRYRVVSGRKADMAESSQMTPSGHTPEKIPHRGQPLMPLRPPHPTSGRPGMPLSKECRQRLTADAQTAWNAITLAEVARSTGGHNSHVSRAIL
jgi:hypothetical protein